MTRVLDKLLLFVFSLIVLAFTVIGLLLSTGAVPVAAEWFEEMADSVTGQATIWTLGIAIILISLRLLYITLRVGTGAPPSIDQRTDFGDIRISMETVENLTLKAASRIKGVKDLKARVSVDDAGLQIEIRAVVDGDTSIPQLTEEVQREVKGHLEEITGIPVSFVSVYVANIIQSQTFKSRVE
ncbi:alkaline shock response membrane anchor protein AmaP [Xylanibacillus composti]|nr:alkaline shock response membrane anchor protein AmaP [Xylanibacillus composti]